MENTSILKENVSDQYILVFRQVDVTRPITWILKENQAITVRTQQKHFGVLNFWWANHNA